MVRSLRGAKASRNEKMGSARYNKSKTFDEYDEYMKENDPDYGHFTTKAENRADFRDERASAVRASVRSARKANKKVVEYKKQLRKALKNRR